MRLVTTIAFLVFFFLWISLNFYILFWRRFLYYHEHQHNDEGNYYNNKYYYYYYHGNKARTSQIDISIDMKESHKRWGLLRNKEEGRQAESNNMILGAAASNPSDLLQTDQPIHNPATSSLKISSYTPTAADSTTVYIVAVAPKNNVRLMALWSQLECFVTEEKIQTIIISAPLSIKGKAFLERFVRHAKESIPHLTNMNVVIKYYINDRYDVGLWCDALKDKMEIYSKDDGNNFDSVLAYKEFVLINDSIMAIRDDFTDVLDVLKLDSRLSMTSLNYSFLYGSKGDHNRSRDRKMWLESVFRAFNRNGITRYMNYACVPASHPYFCPDESDDEVKKRCVVEALEINIANLFHTQEIRGLFPSDVPTGMIREKGLEQVYLWHAHYPFWKNILVERLGFPAMKVSNDMFVTRVKNRAKVMFKKCTRYMKPSLYNEMFERLLEEPDTTIYDYME